MATRGRPFEPDNKMGRGRPKGRRDLMRMSDLAAKMLGAGQITLTQAQEFCPIIEQRRRVIETHEVAKRVQNLEEGRFKRDELLDRAA